MKPHRCLFCAKLFEGTGSICPVCTEKVENESRGQRRRKIGGGLGKVEKATNQENGQAAPAADGED